jgi:hypothetical protein
MALQYTLARWDKLNVYTLDGLIRIAFKLENVKPKWCRKFGWFWNYVFLKPGHSRQNQ